MQSKILSYLQCLECRKTDWNLLSDSSDHREVREGRIICKSCGKEYLIHDGILHAFAGELPEEVMREKEHAESFGYIVASSGEKKAITRETLRDHQNLFLSLPEGDGSHYFQPGGSFDNQSHNANRFYQTLKLLNLTGRERVLEVGASFTWASRHFARKGCEVVALDVTNYLMASDLYFETDNVYYERIMGDMSVLPFSDRSLDIIFSHSVIHHCKDLGKLFSEFRRVLAPGGRVIALHECAFGLLEDKSGHALQEAIHEGFNENAYTIPQWERGACDGGFKKVRTHFFSFIDDYVFRKKLRKSKPTFKLQLAEWVLKRPFLNGLINQVSILPRICFRPKSWMLIAEK